MSRRSIPISTQPPSPRRSVSFATPASRSTCTTFREGHLSPVFFGSALKNFGVGDLLDAIGRMAPPPRAQKADKRTVEADEQNMSAFVFKIQANMDPNHRDRIAFARLCSGKLTRGMKVKQVRTGKSISLNAPQFFFAQDRSVADEAYAGDVVGIPNHGAISIGDTLTEGEEINFMGVPNFAPEILRRVRLPDAMKAKKLKEALQQLAEEGVVQVFRPQDGSPALVGVVGPLAARRAAGAAEGRIRPRSACGTTPSSRWPAGSPRTTPRCWRSSSATTASASPTISTAIRSISRATTSTSATPATARPGIVFTDVKDRHADGKAEYRRLVLTGSASALNFAMPDIEPIGSQRHRHVRSVSCGYRRCAARSTIGSYRGDADPCLPSTSVHRQQRALSSLDSGATSTGGAVMPAAIFIAVLWLLRQSDRTNAGCHAAVGVALAACGLRQRIGFRLANHRAALRYISCISTDCRAAMAAATVRHHCGAVALSNLRLRPGGDPAAHSQLPMRSKRRALMRHRQRIPRA